MGPDPNMLRDCESIGNRFEKAESIQRLWGAKGRKVGEKKEGAGDEGHGARQEQ